MLKTYRGSCHCGAVRFEAEIDLAAGTSRCNCSICAKQRAWGVIVKPDAFRLLAGQDSLGDYQWGMKVGHHHFCKVCGVRTHGQGDVPEIGGKYVGVAVSALDDVAPEDLAAAPVTYCDGLANAWWQPPAVTAYL